jgi:hypothetical protein
MLLVWSRCSSFGAATGASLLAIAGMVHCVIAAVVVGCCSCACV